MKILVTGATGYIGRRLIPCLHAEGYQIRILARKGSDVSAFAHLDNLDVWIGDITDDASLRNIENGIDCVIHMAVLGHLHRHHSASDFFTVNTQGTVNLLQRFTGRGIRLFVYLSSTAALGLIHKKEISETDHEPPLTTYGLSKFRAEEALHRIGVEHSIPYIVVRLTHVYGPGERRDLYRIIKMMKKGYFPQVGCKPNLYPAVYVDDAVRGIQLVLRKGRPGESYIISDRSSHDTREIRNLVRRHLKLGRRFYPVVPKYLTLWLFQVLDQLGRLTGRTLPVGAKNIRFLTAGRRFSISKAQKELGYEPNISLEEGLRRTLDFYLEKGIL